MQLLLCVKQTMDTKQKLQNYIEIVIKDYATFVVCQTDNGYKILEPIQK